MANSTAEQIANIGAGERRKRLIFGIAALVAGIVISGLLVFVRATLLWRLPLICIFYVDSLGYFQSRDKT